MNEILVGWKDISTYLRVTEKTALRYRKEKKLPVTMDPAGHPVITKYEADKWRLKQESV
jgi:hypothetical protein